MREIFVREEIPVSVRRLGSMLGDGRMKGQKDRFLLQRWRFTAWAIANGTSYHVKLLVLIFIVLSTAILASRASSFMGWNHEFEEPKYENSRNRYTMLINTWKRNDLLKKSVKHYASCRGVDAIRVVWSEPDKPSSDLRTWMLNTIASKSRKSGRTPVFHFDVNEEDNLNNRFKPIPGLKTEAVFSVDDDILIPCDTMEFAFNVWLSARDSMVGFVPRMHWVKKHQASNQMNYRYGGWWSVWWTGTYSIVLSKAAFFHSKYLEAYTHQMPTVIRDYVSKQRNCEDIALSFLVANATDAPPIWVKGNLDEIGSTGISSLTGHNQRRTNCVNYFASQFQRMPLVPTSFKAVNARRQWFW